MSWYKQDLLAQVISKIHPPTITADKCMYHSHNNTRAKKYPKKIILEVFQEICNESNDPMTFIKFEKQQFQYNLTSNTCYSKVMS